MNQSKCCVVVAGPYRSGTSLTAQILSALGVDFGSASAFQLDADRFNPGGYFQRKDIVEYNTRLIERISSSIAEPASPELIRSIAGSDPPDVVDLSWTVGPPIFGLKDPRFCATLATWADLGMLPLNSTRLVRVKRDSEAVARSCIAHKEVGSFCGYDLDRARRMTSIYDAYADWHVQNLGVPTFEVNHEALIKNPANVITELAEFLGNSRESSILNAKAIVGKRKARIRHYVRKVLNPSLLVDSLRKTTRQFSS
jgi:hypothetical protein